MFGMQFMEETKKKKLEKDTLGPRYWTVPVLVNTIEYFWFVPVLPGNVIL